MKEINLINITFEELLKGIDGLLEDKLNKRLQVQDHSSDFITRKEVAGILKISLPTLNDWTKLGWLKAYKMGNRVLYKRSEVENDLLALASHKHKRNSSK